jgi:hypothetical protein
MSGIRLGDIPDMQAIVDLGYELLDESVAYSGIKADEQMFRTMVASMMGQKLTRVFLVVDDDDKPQGFLLGLVDSLFFSRDRYATDIAIYVRDGYRHLAPRLAKEFITWAESKPRVRQITLGISSGIGDQERIGKMYETLGLSRVGGIYTKRIQQCPA